MNVKYLQAVTNPRQEKKRGGDEMKASKVESA